VLQLAQRAPEPQVRAAAVNALANIDEREVIEPLAALLRDSSLLVRQTTAEALLWNTEQRWGWIGYAVHGAMADPVAQNDGPLKLPVNQLAPEVVADLHSWSTEKGVLALRAALSLSVYYGQILAAGATPELVEQLRKQLIDPHTPAMLRLELARLLHHYRELDGDALRKLLDSSMPAPVRLIAVEALLAMGNCPEAVAALHDLARLPNREIALATADVVQRRLGVDLGLPRNQPLPPVQSRTAAEVARRVLNWAAEHDVCDIPPPVSGKGSGRRSPSSRVDLGARGSRPGSSQ
jgi:HEAT repeat protein